MAGDKEPKNVQVPPGEPFSSLYEFREKALRRTFLPLALLGILALAGSVFSELSDKRFTLIPFYIALYGIGLTAALWVRLGYRLRVSLIVAIFYALALSELTMYGAYSMAGPALLVLLVFSTLFYRPRTSVVHWAACIVLSMSFGYAYLTGLIVPVRQSQSISLDPWTWIMFVVMLVLLSSMIIRILATFLETLESSIQSTGELVTTLRENQTTLRQVIDLVPESIYAKDEDSRFIFVNRRSAELMGTTPDHAVGKTQEELTPLEEEARVLLAEDEEVLKNGKRIFRREHSYTDQYGNRHIEETTKIPFVTHVSPGKAILGISIDVTRRKRAEELLRHREEHFRHLIENVSDVVTVISPDGTISFASPSVERVLGYERSKNLGRNSFELVHPDDVGRTREAIENGARYPGVAHTLEFRLRHRDGQWITVEAVGQGVVDPDGDVRVVIAYRDITERKLAAAERDRLMSAIEQAAETVLVTDVDGLIQYVNPAFTITTGYTREEAIGENPRILNSGRHDTAFYAKLWDTICSGKTWHGRFINKKKDGTIYTEEATVSPVFDTAGKTINYVAVKRDITREIELERQLRHAQRMEAVGKLAGGVAHDFNNLLQVIQGYTEIALSSLSPGDANRQALDEVANAAERAATLTRQLLTFSRRQVMDSMPLDLNEVISDLLKLVRRVIGENIRMEFSPGRDLNTIYGDRGQIEQVLMNLCVNARDAMPDGGSISIMTQNVTLDNEFCDAHGTATAGPYVVLSVRDTGLGMDKATLERVFEPFFTTKEVGKGTGLGLAMVYGIVDQHLGVVRALSEPNKGSTFQIYLPAVDDEASIAESNAETPVRGGEETILVAEDDDHVRDLAEHILTSAGYRVIVARDGEEAVRVFAHRAHETDLVILNVIMPKLGGHSVLREMRTIRPDVRALFASGYPEQRVNGETESIDHEHFIQKPYKRNELLRKVRDLIDS